MRATVPERTIKLLYSLSAATLLSILSATAWSATANINPSQDNTVAEELPDNSSGACESIFSGKIDVPDGADPGARRALMQFDIAGNIPSGSTINSATLSMTVTRGSNHVDSIFTLHPLTAAWIEGNEGCGVRGGGQGEPSSGGVTWNTQPSFGVGSGSTLINDTAPTWSSAVMTSDVVNWFSNPGNNFGWVLIGDENNPTTTRRFDSSEGATPPVLTVDFDPPPGSVACCFADGGCNLQIDDATCTGTGGDPLVPQTNTCDPNNCPQPTGACCNADRTCSDESKDVCEGAGGTFVGGNCNQADCGLTPFVEALPVPPILQPDNPEEVAVGLKPKYTVSVEEAVQNVHPDLPDTTVWTYNGAWPAATIVATKGEPIEVNYVNNLPSGGGGNRGSNILEIDTCAHGPNDWGNAKRISTHLHGGHLPARFDGQPEYTILPGQNDVYQYPNNQDAGTAWYHDHALGITRLNVYGGMAGFYLIRDDVDTLGINPGPNALNLPAAAEGNEFGLAIQDRTFNEDGSLFYNAQLEDAFKGEYVVVNGKVNPFLNVNQGKYRFRILNGSQSREYIYRLENITDPGNDPSIVLIGTDLGLIDAPIDLGNSTVNNDGPGIIGPAERLDVVIDFEGFPAGTEIILRNDEEMTTPVIPNIMKFIVTDQPGDTDPLPATLRAVTPLPESSADNTRYFRFKKDAAAACKDGSGRLVNEWLIETLDGPGGNPIGKYWDDVTDFPILGTREIWEFENPTNSYHPMHVHLVKFQILDKTDLTTGQPIPLQPWEANTWKDIVHIPANTKARIIMDFEDYAGRFPSHCHLLDHEDHEMMRQFQASYDPANCVVDGVCGPGEDCVSCPDDCGQVSGASCGNGLCEAADGENCVTCAEDCAGRQNGGQQNQYCCGFDDGQVTNPIGCGVDAADARCIDGSSGIACRVTARLSACCGDKLCEGAETESSCANDCDSSVCTVTEQGAEYSCSDGHDNDCDGQIDVADSDCLDPDGDGLTNAYEIYILGTEPDDVDSDDDGLVDGNSGIVLLINFPQGVDADEDGYVDGEQTVGTVATLTDTDGDLLNDGLEIAYGSNPIDPASWPIIADGDCAPYDAPNNQLDGGDLVVALRLALGLGTTRALELAHCDLGIPDDVINAADVLLLIQLLQSQ